MKGHPLSVCTVGVEKDGNAMECGEEVPRPNYSKSYYLAHMEHKARACEAHKAVLEQARAEKMRQQQALASMLKPPASGDEQQARIARLFAKKGWPHATLDDPDFRETWAGKIPDGFNRHALRRRILDLAAETKAAMLNASKGSDVFLLADGGTINRLRHVNFSVGTNRGTYFLKSLRMDKVDSAALKEVILATIEELRRAELFVFAIICDNCAAYQKAMTMVTEAAEDIEDVPDDVLDAANEAAAAQGVFMLRCACHSLQLYLGGGPQSAAVGPSSLADLERDVPIVATAARALETLVEDFAATPERATLLLRAQESLGATTPKGLIRPGKTRWNSKPDAWRRALDLKEYLCIQQLGCSLQQRDWDAMEKAVILTAVAAKATHVIEAEAAGTHTLKHELRAIENNLVELKSVPGMKTSAEKAVQCWNRRFSKGRRK